MSFILDRKINYYTILDLDQNTTLKDIKKAYRRKAHQLHPDKNNSINNNQEFQNLNEAYKNLLILHNKHIPSKTTSQKFDFDYDSDVFFDYFDIDSIRYDTDLYNLTCACKEWKELRAVYPKYDPRRLCQHIIAEFDVLELYTIEVPESLKPFQHEILKNKCNRTGFELYKSMLVFNSSIVAISKDEKKIILYVKEHNNSKCLYSIHYAYKGIDNRYEWSNKTTKENIDKTILYDLEKNIIDAKQYINNKYKIKNSDIYLCLANTLELQKEQNNDIQASKKKYLLSKLFIYSLPLYVYNNNEHKAYEQITKYKIAKETQLLKYDTVENLLKEKKTRFTVRSFNKKLVDMGYLTKDEYYNNNYWILKADGLKYGINHIYNSKYTHVSIPDWYEITNFDFKTLSFKRESRYGLLRMTKVLLEKENFSQLLKLMNQYIFSKEYKKRGVTISKYDTKMHTVFIKPKLIKLQKSVKSFFQKLLDIFINYGT